MSDDDLESLREQSERGSRLEESPGKSSDLVDDIAAVLGEIETGDRGKTIAVRDQPVAALLSVLDENPEEMTAVGQALQEALDRDLTEDFDRSEISRLAFRVGLQNAAPDFMEQLQEAHSQHLKKYL